MYCGTFTGHDAQGATAGAFDAVQNVAGQLRIVSRDPARIKQTLLYQLTNMGQPFIYVVDGNYCNRGELYLE